MAEFGQSIVNGLALSGIFLLLALGITVVFGLTRLINFAHGELLVLGAYLATTLSSHHVSFWWSTLISTAMIGLIAAFLELAVFRFTFKNPINGLIVGIGILQVMQAVITYVWGPGTTTAVRAPFTAVWRIGGVSVGYTQLATVGLAAVLGIGLYLLVRRSRLGRQMAAAQEDPVAAQHVGIRIGLVVFVAFVIGSAIAGTAGPMLGALYPLGASQGQGLILEGFAVALLGGLGNVPGAFGASLIYGFGESFFSTYVSPAWVDLFTFGIIVVVVLVRPAGLFGVGGTGSDSYSPPAWITRPPRALPRWASLGSAPLVVGVVLVAFTLMNTPFYQSVWLLVVIYAIVAYSLSFLYFGAGMLSAAQAAFMAVGAYTAAIGYNHFGLGFWETLVPSVALAGLAGVLVGIPAVRARGHFFILVTFALGSIVSVLLENLGSLTGGDSGIFDAAPPEAIGPLHFDSARGLFFLSGAFLLVVVALVYGIRRTPFGERLAAARDNEQLARSLGLRVTWYRVAAFGISGMIAGLGGVLFLCYQKVIVPTSFDVGQSVAFIAMVVIGGRSKVGPLAGALLLTLVPQLLSLSPNANALLFGLVLVVVLLVLPEGIIPSAGSAYDRLRARLSDRPAAPAPDDPERPVTASAAIGSRSGEGARW
jgi:branched-chain amino acid transport system permease protein